MHGQSAAASGEGRGGQGRGGQVLQSRAETAERGASLEPLDLTLTQAVFKAV